MSLLTDWREFAYSHDDRTKEIQYIFLFAGLKETINKKIKRKKNLIPFALLLLL